MLRIACFTHYAELYGANRSMLEWVAELHRRGTVEALVVMPREGPLAVRLRELGVRTAFVPFVPWMSERPYMGGPHHRLRQWLGHRRAARERARANTAAVQEALAPLRGFGAQAVVANSAAVAIAHRVAARLGLPLLWHVREMPERHYGLRLDAGRRAFGRALGSANCLVAISEAVRTDLLRYVPRATRIEVVPNGVFPAARYAELAARAGERWAHGPFTFLQVGLIHPGKAQTEAVEALALVRRSRPGARLTIAGTGRDKALRERIAALGLEGAVDLPGFVEDVPALCLRAHALLSTSRHEAFGRSIVEAMATGLPVVGHASGGTPELVRDGDTGLLFPGGAEPLAERMLRLMGDPEGARAMGLRAAAFTAARFSVERTADRLAELLLQMVPWAHP